MKVYLAGPITGKSKEAIREDFLGRKDALEAMGYQVILPFMDMDLLRNENLPAHSMKTLLEDPVIVSRDKWFVSQADIMWANFLWAGRVSIGTIMEMAWAFQAGKHIVVTMEDANPHNHAFVKQSTSIILKDIEATLDYFDLLSRSIGMEQISTQMLLDVSSVQDSREMKKGISSLTGLF